MFVTADTVVPNFADPQTLNRYSYARGNPLSYTDPSGHNPLLIAMFVGALFGGIMEELSGGDFVDGLLPGAISGAFFYGAGSFLEKGAGLIEKVAAHSMAGAASGGINAAISGGDVGLGALTGGVAAGISMYAGVSFGLDKMDNVGEFSRSLAGRMAVGGVTGGIAAELYGGDFGKGFGQGATTAGAGFLFNCAGDKISEWVAKWEGKGPLSKNYKGWEGFKRHRPSQANVDNNVFIPGYSSTAFSWRGEIKYKQSGQWSFFGGRISTALTVRSWSKYTYYIGGGYNMPNAGHSIASIPIPDPPPNFYKYAKDQGY